jgi:hypothetical protein
VKAVFGFVNWMVPSMIRANYQTAQGNLMGVTAAEGQNFLGFMLMPTWSGTKGQLWCMGNEKRGTLIVNMRLIGLVCKNEG